MEVAIVIIGVAVVVYEGLSRIIPTSHTWSLIGNILNILKKISDSLDVKK